MSPDKVVKRRQRGSSLTAERRSHPANRVFYAVAEGRVTEYDYLTLLQNRFGQACSFRIDMPSRGSRKDDLTPTRIADLAIAVAEGDRDGQYAEIWALFDRDENVDVLEALERLKRYEPKIRVAFSHPSFDFWLYLHYALYDVPQAGVNGEIHRLLSQRDGWSGFGPKDKKITRLRADALIPRVKTAVDNARSLEKRCLSNRCTHKRNTERCGPLEQDPSSGMWQLMESLGVLPFLK